MRERKGHAGKPEEDILPGHDVGETREVGEDSSAARLPGRPPRVKVEMHRRADKPGRRTSQER